MTRWMGGWVGGQIDVWMARRQNDFINSGWDRVGQWMHEYKNGWVGWWVREQVDGWMEG